MKNLNKYINESIELSAGMIASIFLAACFCIPNGVSTVVQLIKDRGKREAARELIDVLDEKQKNCIKKLNSLDLNKYPQTDKLMNLILSGKDTETVMNQYWVVMHSNEIANRTVHRNIENMTSNYMRNIKARRDKKIKWAVTPSTFLSMVNFSKIFLRK